MPNPELEAKLAKYVGIEIGPPDVGRDAVNDPMIRHWCQALDDENPAYVDPAAAKESVHGGIVAPPTMLQVWILPGIDVTKPGGVRFDKQRELHALFDEYGYTGVVATNTEQGYDRYLQPGDRVSALTTIENISEEKATAIGIGYFIETRTVFRDENDERVGWMTFRVLKFKPAQQPQAPAPESGAPAKPRRLRAPRAHDNGWWWEGIDRGELLIQKCSQCGTLRHPPRPMCGECRSTKWESVVASGKGTVHSYVIMHHPPIPGYDFPIAVGLIDLEEGTRLVANVVGCELDEVHVGMPVECRIEDVDEEMKLPIFHPASGE
jgi:uncharacterized OB-fold protein